MRLDPPIPFILVDPPIPFRVRVLPPSAALRAFTVPGTPRVPADRKSGRIRRRRAGIRTA